MKTLAGRYRLANVNGRGGMGAAVTACLVAACSGQYEVRIEAPREAGEIGRMEVSLIASCDEIASPGDPPRTVIRQVVIDSDDRAALGHVDSGAYGLYARAWDDDCRLVAAGCSPVEVEEGGEGTLEVVMVLTSGRFCDPGQACRGGKCDAADAGAAPEDSGADGGGPESDASTCVDEDGDRACADRDCDDLDPRRSPDLVELCPDHADNDCDESIDFDDTCDVLPDRCEEPFALLLQVDGPTTTWRFDGLPLDTFFGDDYAADVSTGGDDGCDPRSGDGGGDAVFEIRATAASDLEVTVSGGLAGDPVVYLRPSCGATTEGCSEGLSSEATLRAVLDAGDEVFLFVDENVASPVDVAIFLRRR